MPATLVLAAATRLATAAAFLIVARRIHGRPVSPALRSPRTAFVLWWCAFAAYLAGQGALDLAAAAGATPLWAFAGFRLATGPLLGIAAAGLASYVLFLWSGRGWPTVLAFYYGAAGALYSYSAWTHHPDHVEVTAWTAGVAYAQPLEGPLLGTILASFGLPLVLGSLAYLGLALRVHGREQQYRIVLVGSSILLWVTSGFAAEMAGSVLARFIAIVLLGLLTAIAVLAAYFPPAPVRRWLQRSPLAEG